jgi:alkylation response protein AidB-like acyl-CoA dehydrogenase
MSAADQGMGLGLRWLGRFASLDVIDRIGLRSPAERLIYGATKNGFKAASSAGRTFAAAQKLTSPKRLPKAKSSGMFDLTPDDEQQMLVEAFGDFAMKKLRPAALEADAACAAPPELLAQVNDLGVTMLGVPEELDGAVSESSAVTSVLCSEALARGDMGLAYAALAPAAVATALALWGDADQQSTYLPPFVGDDIPAAALALLEPAPLFDPFTPATTATRKGDGWELNGLKSLVARAAEAELFVIGAKLGDGECGLFIVEAKTPGVSIAAEPAMGLRAAATSKLSLEKVQLGAGARLGDAGSYADCVRRSRLAWCALAVGTAQAALDYLIPYVNERIAFGEPISHRQAVAFTVSDVAIESDGMRLATYRAASRADLGKDFFREVAIARRLCANKGMKIGSDAVQLLGGHGYIKEHPVERWYRDLRAAGLMEGGLLV